MEELESQSVERCGPAEMTASSVICSDFTLMWTDVKTLRQFLQFIKEVQNCPDLWDVSPGAHKDTKNKRVLRSKGWISTHIRFRVQTFLFF